MKNRDVFLLVEKIILEKKIASDNYKIYSVNRGCLSVGFVNKKKIEKKYWLSEIVLSTFLPEKKRKKIIYYVTVANGICAINFPLEFSCRSTSKWFFNQKKKRKFENFSFRCSDIHFFPQCIYAKVSIYHYSTTQSAATTHFNPVRQMKIKKKDKGKKKTPMRLFFPFFFFCKKYIKNDIHSPDYFLLDFILLCVLRNINTVNCRVQGRTGIDLVIFC